MQNENQNKLGAAAAMFLKRTAQKPFAAFFFLLVVFVAISILVFFSFRQQGAPENQPSPSAAKGLFDDHKAQKYRQVFSILDQRGNSSGLVASSTYPDLFGSGQELLTEPQN